MTEMRLLTVAVGLAALVACVGNSDTQELTQGADQMLRDNNLPGAHAQYEAVAAANPESVFAATGLAHSQMLAGDYDAAQKTLAQAQAAADKAGSGQQLRLRRAIVALSAGDLSAVSQYGAESQLPEGMVMAAEVHLADVEPDEAIGLLRQVSGGQGPAAATAKAYLSLLESGESAEAGLAEATALWSLGLREEACEGVDELLRELERDDRDELLILWAGRAVTSGQTAVARSLLDGVEDAGDHIWRVQATAAMVDVVDEQYDSAQATFETLTMLADAGQISRAGVLDAKATAAALAKDREFAKTLLGGVGESVPASMGLHKAGAVKAARDAAPGGSLWSTFLENR